MTNYLIGAALFILVSYGGVEAWPLIMGPSLTVDVPAQNESFPSSIVTVQGRTSRVAELTINGALALYDQKGDFSSTLTFPRGGSILTFVATDRFGRQVTATRTIFVP